MATFRPIVVAGPSGSGKSTLLKRLMAEFSGCFAFSVSHTTRQPRSGEVDGREYHFVSRENMLAAIERGEFIESAEFSGNLYGTSIRAVQDAVATGRICILEIDMQGVKQVKQTTLNPLYVFVKPPSFQILEERLRHRGSEDEESIQRRLGFAKEELAYASMDGVFDRVVVNDDLENAYGTYRNIFLPFVQQLQQGKATNCSSNGNGDTN